MTSSDDGSPRHREKTSCSSYSIRRANPRQWLGVRTNLSASVGTKRINDGTYRNWNVSRTLLYQVCQIMTYRKGGCWSFRGAARSAPESLQVPPTWGVLHPSRCRESIEMWQVFYLPVLMPLRNPRELPQRSSFWTLLRDDHVGAARDLQL
jgi:hypothetical protein